MYDDDAAGDCVITDGCEVVYAVTMSSSILRLMGCNPLGLVGQELAALGTNEQY